MPWSGSGQFTRLFSWVADKAASINITASRCDADANDITGTGLGNALTRDGQGGPTVNLPMLNFRHTGVCDATAFNQYATAGQVQRGDLTWGGTSAGAANVFNISLFPAQLAADS